MAAMNTSSLDRQVQQRLADADVRYTRGRREVVDTLASLDGPRSAAELHEVMGGGVPLSSLYRTLTVLEETGILAPHYSSPGLTRYELAEWLTGHHHHLVCIDCGQVEDIDVDEKLESELHRIVSEVSLTASFVDSSHALEIEGRCGKCA